MRVAVGLLLLGSVLTAAAKKPTMYRCQQPDGRVVIQDRRCSVTQLPETRPKTPVTKRPQTATTPPPREAKPAQVQPRQGMRPVPPQNQRQSRSPYFAADWSRFIPKHWQKLRIQTQQNEQWLISLQAFEGLGDFNQGVRLAVYANTLRNQRQGAFALALQLYQQLRDNPGITLLDSQYKSHPNFKVFNVKYQNADRQLVVTEYYIDEQHHDLFVLTVQAPANSWSAQWLMAEHIINQL
ncbi:hypothetical protein [Marinicella meishanensis]|uniref:hypothetical protein n=1 Tax=Marinicella meishanensis TaxID=2873263 RepID=UPI001CBD6874|nr:hypothetical protein [Marinicella sp. NBU2979]